MPGCWVGYAPCGDLDIDCIDTAIDRACRGDLTTFSRCTQAMKRIVGCSGALFSWNDAPGRTLDEVLAAFDKAIAAEEAR